MGDRRRKPNTEGGRHHGRRLLIVIVSLVAAVVVIGGAGLYLARHTAPVQSVLHPLRYTDEISSVAACREVNPYWICAVIDTESSWDANAVSSAGAVGLMQVQPDTASDLAQWGLVDSDLYPPDDLTDPVVNIEYGTAYLRYLVERYHQMEPAIAAYNAGPGNVDEWLAENPDVKLSIDFGETSDYLVKVEEAKSTYEQLYPDAFPDYTDDDSGN